MGQIGRKHQTARPQVKAARRIVGITDQDRGQNKGLFAQPKLVARGQSQPIRQNLFHHRTGQTACSRKRICKRHFGAQCYRADQGIGRIDRSDLGQGAFGIAPPVNHHHGPEFDSLGNIVGDGIKVLQFVRTGEAIGKLNLGVAPEQARPFAVQPRLDRRAHHANGSDGSHAQRQTGQKDAKPVQTAAQFAACQAAGDGETHSAALASGASIRPSRRRITRSQRRARSSEWVTRISVAPCLSRRLNSRSMIANPLA